MSLKTKALFQEWGQTNDRSTVSYNAERNVETLSAKSPEEAQL